MVTISLKLVYPALYDLTTVQIIFLLPCPYLNNTALNYSENKAFFLNNIDWKKQASPGPSSGGHLLLAVMCSSPLWWWQARGSSFRLGNERKKGWANVSTGFHTTRAGFHGNARLKEKRWVLLEQTQFKITSNERWYRQVQIMLPNQPPRFLPFVWSEMFPSSWVRRGGTISEQVSRLGFIVTGAVTTWIKPVVPRSGRGVCQGIRFNEFPFGHSKAWLGWTHFNIWTRL